MEKNDTGLSYILDILGEILAFLTILVFAVVIADTLFSFIPDNIMAVLVRIMFYAPLTVVGITALEYAFNKGFLTKIIVLVLVAVVIISQFFGDLWQNIATSLLG